MLAHPTLDLLHALGLHGMAKAFKDLDQNSEARALDHVEWLGLLIEHEMTLCAFRGIVSTDFTAS